MKNYTVMLAALIASEAAAASDQYSDKLGKLVSDRLVDYVGLS